MAEIDDLLKLADDLRKERDRRKKVEQDFRNKTQIMQQRKQNIKLTKDNAIQKKFINNVLVRREIIPGPQPTARFNPFTRDPNAPLGLERSAPLGKAAIQSGLAQTSTGRFAPTGQQGPARFLPGFPIPKVGRGLSARESSARQPVAFDPATGKMISVGNPRNPRSSSNLFDTLQAVMNAAGIGGVPTQQSGQNDSGRISALENEIANLRNQLNNLNR